MRIYPYEVRMYFASHPYSELVDACVHRGAEWLSTLDQLEDWSSHIDWMQFDASDDTKNVLAQLANKLVPHRAPHDDWCGADWLIAWQAVDAQPFHNPYAHIIQRHFGSEALLTHTESFYFGFQVPDQDMNDERSDRPLAEGLPYCYWYRLLQQAWLNWASNHGYDVPTT